MRLHIEPAQQATGQGVMDIGCDTFAPKLI